MAYTVKKVADLAGISVRALHHYDAIGLLKPSAVGANGYRYYSDDDLLRLQQILLFREMDLSLAQIKAILNIPEFDRVAALQTHRQALEGKIARLKTLIETVDATLLHITEEVEMSKKKIFSGFSEAQQKKHEKEAIQRWGEDSVKPTLQLWNSYSDEKKEQIKREGGQIYLDLVKVMGEDPASPTVQAIIARWHQHLHYFYAPSLERLRGLGHMYNDHPDFHKNFAGIHPDLPAFLPKAIDEYVDTLELKELGLLEA